MKTGKKLHKQADQVQGSMVQMGAKMMAEMEAQKKLLPKIEAEHDKVSRDMVAIQRRLKGRETDPKMEDLRTKYFDLVATRDELAQAIQMTEESIAEAQTLYTRGLPEDDSVLGPNS